MDTSNLLHTSMDLGDDDGPFMTNGEMREIPRASSEIESETVTVTMFNLNKLNEEHPEWLCRDAWSRGQILEAPDSLIDLLAQRVKSWKFK